ncbi:MFS transporter [Arachnia propionica]|uniref:MFS transporter n=1 Tax=Arachnia propionica TaxID=1750 RepID=A0A3P1TBD9_9ACTN|nr:MFS transporter [Arachnia propionica]RRD05793.1 MFS transporter [Arachnia propionica]
MNLRNRLRATGLPRSVWVLAVTNFLVAIGFGVVIPVLGPFARTFGATNFQLGLVVSMFALMRLVTAPLATRISRRIGERNAITLGMVIVATTTFGVAMAPDLWWMIIVRALGGIGSVTFTIAAFNLMIATTPQQLRGRAAGLNQGGFLLGNMTGPALGGLLGAISLQAPFHFYSVMLLLSGLVAFLLLPARATPLPSTAKQPRPFKEVLQDIRYQAACVMGFAQGWQSIGVRSALIPVMITEIHHKDTGWAGIAFAVAALVQTLALTPAGLATDRIGRRPVMVTTGLLCGIATFAMPFSPNVWVLILLLCLYGIGGSMLGTAPTAAVGDATQGRGGAPVAVYSMILDLGAIIGPLAVGAIVDHAGHAVGFAVGGCIFLLGALVAFLIPEELDRSSLIQGSRG